MMSRQSIMQAYSNQSFDFNQTDAINICADINKEAIDWALSKAPIQTVKRYLMKGTRYISLSIC
jgi:hypothetical protein